jgi:subtilisin family serine protease/subtilisin-like proprotein convertase family protein
VLYEVGRPRNEFSRRILTAAVTVQLADGAKVDSLVKATGAVGARPAVGLRGWFVFRAATASDSFALAARLRAQPGVLKAEPQLARLRQSKHLPDDEFFPSQWHLLNIGQTGGLAGVDINVTNVWDTWRGAGCVIGIVDTGFETNHPDLAPNYRDDLSRNLDGNPLDSAANWHGTLVAGLAAARGDNSTGVAGVAYEAGLADLRISEMSYDAQEAEAMAFRNDAIQVKNNSWGAPDATFYEPPQLDGPGFLTVAALADATASGRNGLGEVYLFAAGNGRAHGDNANYDGYANSPFVICVGAVNDLGEQSSFSESGACLAVCAPSGSGPSACDGGRARLATTDLTGDFGLNTNGVPCDLANVDYTTNATGTSASVPVVSGVAALVLQARPELGWRDLKEILMRSATRVSPSDPEWATNASGLATNPKFGAGLVNAGQAVSLAANWLPMKAMTQVSWLQTNLGMEIPDNDPVGTNATFLVPQAGFRVETVVLTVTIAHDRWGDLAIKLISPSGIVSPLAEPHPSKGIGGIPGWAFTSIRNWGEDSCGEWTVQVADLAQDFVGTLDALRLDFLGSVPVALALVKTNADALIALSVSPANWPCQKYDLEASPDLTAWTFITTLQADLTGHAFWIDTSALEAARFYRAVPAR